MNRLYVSTADRYAPLDDFWSVQGLGQATGGCGPGKGNWLPLPTKVGFIPVCPGSPLWPRAVAYNRRRNKALQGLGSSNQWPAGRSYYDVSQYRAPYRVGYFQDGSLMGLGSPSGSVTNAVEQNASPNVKRFLVAGEPVPTLGRDMSLPFNQVSRTAYAVIGVAALGISYFSYKQFKKRQKAQSGGGHP